MDSNRLYDPSYAPFMEPKRGHVLLVLAYIAFTADTLALLLRFWSRAVLPSRKRFQADDWTALAAYPCAVGIPTVAFYTLTHGFGHHVNEVPLGDLEASLKWLFFGILCFYLGTTLIRISATLFYRRVLDNYGHNFGRWVWANVAINAVFFIAMVPIIVTTCHPVESFWNRTIPGHKCRSAAELMNSAGVVAAILDVITLLLPLPIIMRLRLDWPKKLLVCAIFILGYSVVVFSIGRAIVMFRLGSQLDTDVTWSLVDAKVWIDLEVAVAYISISLPAIFAMGKRAKNHGLASLFNKRQYLTPTSTPAQVVCRQISQFSGVSETTYVDHSEVQLKEDIPIVQTKETRSWSIVVQEV